MRVEVTTQGGELKIGSEELHEDVHGPLPVRVGLDFAKPVRKASITVTIVPAGK